MEQASNANITLSLIFPCYCEETHLEKNLNAVIDLLETSKYNYEVILVDDASPDRTQEIIKSLTEKHTRVTSASHKKNLGRGAAFLTGLKHSRGEFVGYFDIDLEVAPHYLLDCMRALQEQGADLVIGYRIYKISPDLIHRFILSKGYSLLKFLVLGMPMSLDSESGYKFFKRASLLEYENKFIYSGWFWDTEVVNRFLRQKKNVVSVPCLFIRNADKRSTVKLFKDSVQYFYSLMEYRVRGFIKEK